MTRRMQIISTATITWTGDATDINDAIVRSEAAIAAWLDSAPSGVVIDIDRDVECADPETGDPIE